MRIEAGAVLSSLAVAFTAYLVVGGLWWYAPVAQPWLLAGALALYLATTWLCIFLPGPAEDETTGADQVVEGPRGPTVLPRWASVLAVAVAAVTPVTAWLGAGVDARTEAFATWPIGAIGALMTVVIVRRRPWHAWSGIALLAIASTVWVGVPTALALGLVGSVMWVAMAQLIVLSTDRAGRDTLRLVELQLAASEWLASQAGRQRERRVQVQRALSVAGPVLSRTIETGGDLDPHERELARLAEGRLRDELRGRRLLDDAVRTAIDDARRAGANVTVLDEGGLDGLDAEELSRVRAALARALRAASSEQIYIRAAGHDRIAVTIVGRSRRDGEETVDLWEEIPRSDTA